MQQAGAVIVKHYRDLAFMGFTEVIRNLPAIFRNIRFCKTDISIFNPDVVVFIDYPGFNLRIAGWAKQSGYRTVYYISPQVWAWKESRVRAIRDSIDKMLVILPFEKDFYGQWDYAVEYVGHPLVEVIANSQIQHFPLYSGYYFSNAKSKHGQYIAFHRAAAWQSKAGDPQETSGDAESQQLIS